MLDTEKAKRSGDKPKGFFGGANKNNNDSQVNKSIDKSQERGPNINSVTPHHVGNLTVPARKTKKGGTGLTTAGADIPDDFSGNS